MMRKSVFAGVAALALLAGPAYAAMNENSPPEPYTAPDPVYPSHKVVSDVTIHQQKDTVSLTDNGAPMGGNTAK